MIEATAPSPLSTLNKRACAKTAKVRYSSAFHWCRDTSRVVHRKGNRTESGVLGTPQQPVPVVHRSSEGTGDLPASLTPLARHPAFREGPPLRSILVRSGAA